MRRNLVIPIQLLAFTCASMRGESKIASYRHLFLDDAEIFSMHGLARRLHPPRRLGPVLRANRGQRQTSTGSRSVPQWNPKKQIWEWWYWATYEEASPIGAGRTARTLVHYATSKDGKTWETPNLGLYEWQGTKKNNIAVDPGLGGHSIYHVLRDDRDPDPSRRYKALFIKENAGKGRFPAVSPDGFHWTMLPVPPIPSQDESHLTYDETSGLFLAIVKSVTAWGRTASLAVSKDFAHWSEPKVILHSDLQDKANRVQRLRTLFSEPGFLTPSVVDDRVYIAEIYQMSIMPYEGLYIGFPGVFNPIGTIPPPGRNFTRINQVELAVARDLFEWERVADRQVFLGVEPWDGVSFDTSQLLTCGRPVVWNDEIRVYYNGIRFGGFPEQYPHIDARFFRDESALSLATLPRDRFVSLDAGLPGGELITKTLVVTGPRLYVNVDAAAGKLQAELLTGDRSRVLEGFRLEDSLPVTGNQIGAPLGWRGAAELGALRGKEVSIRFHLEKGRFYSYWFAE